VKSPYDDEEEEKQKDLAFDHMLAEEVLRAPQADQDEIKAQRLLGLRASPRGRQIFSRKKRVEKYQGVTEKKTMDQRKKMIDLRKKPSKAKTLPLATKVLEDMDIPPYPSGLRVSLDNEGLARLDLDIGNFKVGDQITFSSMGEIVSVSEDKFADGRIDRKVDIQIIETDLGQ